MIIGICGKSGSGKSTLAKEIIELTNMESVHLDIDKVGHQVLTIPEAKMELIETFGNDIVVGNDIDRKRLGKIVFASKSKMQKLSDITWGYMQIEIDKFLDEHKDKLVILDWLLLPITKYFNMCDMKILLDIPNEIRKKRAVARDNISDSDFDLREKSSIDFDLESFDYVLKSNEMDSVKGLVKFL